MPFRAVRSLSILVRCVTILAPVGTVVLTRSELSAQTMGRTAPVGIRWRLASTPTVAIGAPDGTGPTEFAGVAGVVRLADGRIVVADAGSTQLRIFGADGRFLETIGRKGSGPGEMHGVDGLFYSSDSLYVRDSFGGAHVFSGSGAYARSMRFVVGSGKGFGVHPVGVMANSGLVGSRPVREAHPSREGTTRAEIRRLAGDGVSVRVLAQSPSHVSYRLASGRTDRLGFSPALALVAFPREACFAYTETFVITCVDSLGAPTRTIRDTARPRAVSDSMKRAWQFAMSGSRPGGGSRFVGALREHRERVAREAQFADKLPVIGRLLAAQTGDLWVSEYQPSDGIVSGTGDAPGAPSGPTTWRIFSPKNALRATLVTPARFRVFDAGDGWALGVSRDAEDIETVEMWRIEAR